jgi:5,10-methylenetetrahydromethanopterin reductase
MMQSSDTVDLWHHPYGGTMADGVSKPALGVIFHPSFPSETLADYARRAEDAGFDALWLWDDCFQPGALTSAAIALAATRHLKVGIGLMPATVINPLFVAMELTTLAWAFPERILPGLGFGVPSWMSQIGAAPRSYIKALDETLVAVRRILAGEEVTMHGQHVHLEKVQMNRPPDHVPPLYVGAMREKSLALSGRIADGTILPAMSSPAYIRWVWEQVRAGMQETGRSRHQMVVFLDVKVSPDGASARDATRQALAARLPWPEVQVTTSGLAAEVAGLIEAHGLDRIARHIPDAWVDTLAAAGTPDQVFDSIERVIAAGTDMLVLQPLEGDPACLDEYSRYLMPRLLAST